MSLRFALLASSLLVGCTTEPNDVVVQLAPTVVSSLDGTVAVHVIALADRTPVNDQPIEVTIDYKDRNGTSHTIAPVDGRSGKDGAFDTSLTGLTFDGTGTVTASIGGTTVSADATFAVLDRTPPAVTITGPANNQIHVNTTARISVTVKDEIGVSQIFFESDANGNNQRDRSTITTGAADVSVGFDVQANDTQVGQTITLHALAADLSGNLAAAAPLALTVVP
jgi:hypothetical protein